MSSQEYALHGFTYPRSLELDSSNPYLQPELPEPIFDQIWENMKKAAVDNLSKYDPSHKELYESMLKEGDSLFDPQFKPAMRDYFAGCFDMKSPMFQQMARNVTGKLMTYMRFSTERKMYRKELDKIVIKNPIFITSLPRSGSTYLHNFFK
ncbi:sulfotransferase, putative [Entamoeba histolytica HM-3:IMSS]|uniref:Sulfotransferase, putative n=1 Tax=Entamoeba histolytica HM-3:IMSS TaxID=885315 RepID=M7X2I8_ENTHI|nr:sulfotransferase, putative [Entamoeba histolytica HM-3:IMSS]